MRVRLKEGKQKELIEKAKGSFSWKELSKMLNISKDYLRLDIRKEKRLLPEMVYIKLCKMVGKTFNNYIVEKLDDNWGRRKGGENSEGSTIKLKISDNKHALAELVGVILGDGNINFYKKGKKIGVYQIKIAGDYEKDKKYHLGYIKPLCESLFNLKVKEIVNPKHNERFLVLSSRELVEFFVSMGLKSGDKIRNQLRIPNWIFKKDSYLRVCLRGLIDTDGSIFRMSKRDYKLLRISFTNKNLKLLEDARNSFIKLGFTPNKIINNQNFYLSRQGDIEKYLREIGFSNQKHTERLQGFKNSPVV